MKVEILIFSIVRDIPYLDYCLRSIIKFTTGFTGTTICVPIQEKDEFLSKAPKFQNGLSIDGKGEFDVKFYNALEDREKWHLAHQAEKCRADYYVPENTDFVWHIDSDCVLIKPTTPEDYITSEGKPILCIEEYAKMREKPWKEQTSRALGINAKWETMRVHGAIHFTSMYPEFRSEIEKVHRKPFVDYVMGGQASFPWHFSEFNALGNYVLTSRWNQKYQLIDVGVNGYPAHHMLDFWSHAPIEQAQPNRYRGLFPDTMTVKQIYAQLGLD